MRGRAREGARALALLLLALVSSCSSTTLFYNNLDWFGEWQVGKFVDLDRAQRRHFDQAFGALWQWHRSTQLPLYAADLRALADEPLPVTTERVAEWSRRFGAHAWALVGDAAERSAPVMRAFSDAQVQDILDRLARDRAEAAEDLADTTRAERDREDAERLVDQLEDWVGKLSKAQRARVDAWAAARSDTTELWLENRAAWAERFAGVLQQRRDAGFAATLRAHFVDGPQHWAPALRSAADLNSTAWRQFLADLSATLDQKQAAHLRRRLREIADELERLSHQSK